MSPADDFDSRTIADFRANGGKVGGNFEGAPLLLLHSTGARSGEARINPVMYLADGDRYLVFASKGGSPSNPAWYHNLMAHPEATIEVGRDTLEVRAVPLTGKERDELYQRQSTLYPGFAEYQAKTKRTIPVVALTPKSRA
ncbi:MAG TPA: nitroreductase family deazaflavin-dependent oxidoreductase [Candidatus Dormibacteraeota bacterium]|nr:nitroreductase family deazaflavin-dependent oxidoreductase [Candidatus Dormibacteraeota bacterium]